MTPSAAPARARGTTRDGGFLTVQYVAAVGLSLVLLTMIVNAIVFQYARSVVRTAVADGARAGARAAGDVAACAVVANDVVDELLSGPLADSIELDCEVTARGMAAIASVRLQPWLPALPEWQFEERAEAPVEAAS